MYKLDDPRASSRQAILDSVDPATWERNVKFSHELLEVIASHRLGSHPILAAMDSSDFDIEWLKFFHLEFSRAFAEIFTDSLVYAMATCSQLEPLLGAKGKVAARFLLQINMLDELGFQPMKTDKGEYAGHPYLAHYVQFTETLVGLGLSEEEIKSYVPGDAIQAARASFEDYYGKHKELTCVLAVAETIFSKFAGPWAKNTGDKTSLNVSEGYHSIHVEDDHGDFVDDEHSEDSWYVFRQAITSEDYDAMRKLVIKSLDVWANSADYVYEKGMDSLKKTA
jgi:hypothetical protein